MPSGTHRHLKRLAAPTTWGLEKSGGTFAIRMRAGAHSKALAIPLGYVVSRFLGVAKNGKEISYILRQNHILVNGRTVTDKKSPVGLFDVITIKKTNTSYKLIMNVNGKLKIRKITNDAARHRITKVRAKDVEDGIPYTRTIDGFNFRFADPAIKVNDTVLVDIASNKIIDFIPFETGKIAFVFGGSNAGRVGVIKRIDTLKSGHMFLYLSDARQRNFTVQANMVMVVGDENRILTELNEEGGIKYNDYELSNKRYAIEKVAE